MRDILLAAKASLGWRRTAIVIGVILGALWIQYFDGDIAEFPYTPDEWLTLAIVTAIALLGPTVGLGIYVFLPRIGHGIWGEVIASFFGFMILVCLFALSIFDDPLNRPAHEHLERAYQDRYEIGVLGIIFAVGSALCWKVLLWIWQGFRSAAAAKQR